MIESYEEKTSAHLKRAWSSTDQSQLDWRQLLDSFLQEEVQDYTFMPPDRRFADTLFFLPDFNERDRQVKDILFMVDSSGSVDNTALSMAFAEISRAIEQYNGKLQGRLSFFDTEVTRPIPFSSVQQLKRMRSTKRGGTEFGCVFRYLQTEDSLPACIVIFTDGQGEYPAESAALGVPVLWILHSKFRFPPWGKIACI